MCGARAKGGRPSAEEAELLPERMFEAAWELLLQQGFEGFSFDKLARHARIGKPTIYARFANKEAFLRALLQHRIAAYQSEITTLAEDLPFADALKLMALRAVMRFQSDEGRLTDRLVDWLEHEGDPKAGSVRQWAFANGRQRGEGLMRAAVERGEVAISDIPLAAQFFLEGVVGHARMGNIAAEDAVAQHERWANDYSAMILRAFDRSKG